MALSSQSVPPRGRSGMMVSRGRRRGRNRGVKRVVGAVAVLGVVGLGWALFSGGSPDDPADPGVAGGEVTEGDSSHASAAPHQSTRTQADPQSFETDSEGVPGGGEPPQPDPAGLAGAGVTGGDPSDDSAQAEARPQREQAEPEPSLADASADEAAGSTGSRATRSSPRAGESASDRRAEALMAEGQAFFEEDRLVEAREVLNEALASEGLNRTHARDVRDIMAQINEVLIFSPRVVDGDPYVDGYEVQPGDNLERIARPYKVPWELISRINGDLDPRRIRVGQRLKMINGPFHVVVHKRDYRLDVYLDDMYVRSFDVGLGEHDMTPTGEFIVNSPKLRNPEWTNPRTGERFLPDDPENPLGGYWIGITGTDEETARRTGYGIHGTIEPDTIGTDASMGCVRLLPEDASVLYDMLTSEQSRVLIRD